MWGAPGKDAATLGTFFDALPEGDVEAVEAVSMDLGPAYAKAVRKRAPDAVICFDPFYAEVLVMPMSAGNRLLGRRCAALRSA